MQRAHVACEETQDKYHKCISRTTKTKQNGQITYEGFHQLSSNSLEDTDTTSACMVGNLTASDYKDGQVKNQNIP